MNKSIKTNERELTSKISEWINEIINRNPQYPFNSASVETGISVEKSKTRFGDLIIWKDRESTEAYSYMELKPPLGDSENLETFKEKAIELKVDYAFTWDFQNLRAYKITRSNIELIGTETESILTNVNDWVRADKQASIKAYLNKILDELVTLKTIGKLRKFYPDKIYFVNFIRDIVSKLIPNYEKFLREASRKSKNKHLIAEYAAKQGIAFPSDAEYYKLIARQSVYALVTKIIFYLTIKRYFTDLPDLYEIDEPDLSKRLNFAFARAREKDWQAVFVEDPIEILGLPETIYDDLRLFFKELKVYHFGELSEDVIGELFEEIIDPNERHLLGQYFTNEDLVDLIIGFVVQNKDGYYGDPTCGSGTFLIRLYDRLRYLNSGKFKHTNALQKIWGMDIGKFPAELSTINLFRQDVSNYENFPKVICTDIFDVEKGKSFEFPPINAGKDFEKIKIALPEFDALVGNFPFIRQELIEKKSKGYKKKLTKVLAYEYLLTYPKLFKLKNIKEQMLDEYRKLSPEKLKTEIDRLVDKNNIELKLSGQADIYTHIYIHTATLLAKNGMFAIITSNSWLDVSYGSVLKEFFLDNFRIKAVIASWAEPWFEEASINTVVTVLEKKTTTNEKQQVKFVKLKKKLSDLIPQRDLKLESIARWQRVDSLIDLIETAEYHKSIKQITGAISSVEVDEMRIRLISQEELLKELKEKSELAKWGKYLRAPDVYFEILEKCKNKLVPLKDIADVRRGYTTGINDFFYLKVIENKNEKIICRNDRGWEGEIEEKYLRPVIKSPKESSSITIDPAKLKYHIFICNKSKSELRKEGDYGALNYIEWGEKQKTKQNINWTEVPSVKGKKLWYGLQDVKEATVFVSKGINDRYFFAKSEIPSITNNRLYNIYPRYNYLENFLLLLNSTMEYLFLEIDSRVNLGDGLIDNGIDAIKDLYVFKKNVTLKEQNKFNKLIKRKVLSIFREVKQKDRKELDTAVLKALGLEPKEYLPKIYEGLTEIVKERLELPKMRKIRKAASTKFAYDQIKETVVKEIIPKGVKQFPQAFYLKGNYDELDFDEYSSNGKELKSESFFNQYELKDEEGKVIFTVDSEYKAEYAELLSRKETYQVKIPKQEKIVEEILKRYKTYRTNLFNYLEKSAQEKLHDWNLAGKMAKEILEEWI